MHELKSYLPKVKEILSDIIEKYNFDVYVASDREIILRNSNCIMKMTVGWYYVDFGLEFFDPKNPNHEGLSAVEIFEKKGLLGKKNKTDEQIKNIEECKDEVLQHLLGISYSAKYYTEYFEGNFD
jgi:hypothetical protein